MKRNIMNHCIKLALLIFVFGGLVSCSNKGIHGEGILGKVKDEVLLDALDSISEVKFDSFYSRISTAYKDSNENLDFTNTIRIVSDSAILSTITYARIPMVISLINLDSVKVSNRKDKCYVEEDQDFLRQSFGIDLGFKNVQELLMGQPVGFEIDRQYFRTNDHSTYTMSSHRKRDIKRNERKQQREIITSYTLSEDLKSIEKIQIDSPEDDASILIDYKTREMVDGYLLPHEVEIKILTKTKNILVELEYRKQRINQGETIHFVIPDTYEKCD